MDNITDATINFNIFEKSIKNSLHFYNIAKQKFYDGEIGENDVLNTGEVVLDDYIHS